ncbi:hypothetical protein [Flexivirga sp. B27]
MSWERLTGQLRNGDGWLVVSGVVAAGTAIFTAVGAVVVGITLLHLAGDPAEGIGVKQYAMVIFGGLTVVLVCAAVMSAAAALGCRRGEATAPGIALAPLVVIGLGFYAVVHHTAGRPAWLLVLPAAAFAVHVVALLRAERGPGSRHVHASRVHASYR